LPTLELSFRVFFLARDIARLLEKLSHLLLRVVDV
jgi:hypothetical protein